VGLGANLGDRLATMREALRQISAIARVDASSRVYETAAVGGPQQPPFLNAAVLVAYGGTPIELLDSLQAIEARLGRVRAERWGPRVIDLDILWIEGLALDSERLVIPHAHLRERAFAVAPLRDVMPDACDPLTGDPYDLPSADLRDTGERL
jgi:2-amino-4-hydroxy-6-hydroxymethyldihydropteridine diphosphokinase